MTIYQWLGVVLVGWGVLLFFVMCLCQAAAMADNHPAEWFKDRQ